jgi:hypothetical protein
MFKRAKKNLKKATVCDMAILKIDIFLWALFLVAIIPGLFGIVEQYKWWILGAAIILWFRLIHRFWIR